jgi:nitrite reductase/ring-hydroxylating ferredoxin subunit
VSTTSDTPAVPGGTPGTPPTGRRTLITGAVAGVLAVGGATALTACGAGRHTPAAVPTAPVDLGSPDAVPVGGVKLYRDERLLVACPKKGEYRAFSAVCTHAGCVLDGVKGTTVTCSCHGSEFDGDTGAVEEGPATRALPAVPVRVAGGRLVAGPHPASPSAKAGVHPA